MRKKINLKKICSQWEFMKDGVTMARIVAQWLTDPSPWKTYK
jgi:hypothetical protein